MRIDQESIETPRRGRFLQYWIRGSSSILAIIGGELFLVLPVAFFIGPISLVYPPQPEIFSGTPPFLVEMAPFWASLGAIGILLGFLVMKIGEARNGVALGLAFSLGSMALLFAIVTSQILRTWIITPASFLLFPELAILAMAVATALFSYGLSQAKNVL